MPIETRQVTLSNVTPKMIAGHDNMPHQVVLHNATKSSNEYVYVSGSSATAGISAGFHIDPGGNLYLELGPEDVLWATSDPDGLIVHVIDVRKKD